MSIEQTLLQRSNGLCELCGANNNLSVYEVPPVGDPDSDKCVFLCETCNGQIADPTTMDANHWRCLNDSMWSQTPAVQVMAWRMLDRLKVEGWAHDLLDMLYMEQDLLNWAKAAGADVASDGPTVDSNGAILQAGDTVTLIKDLVVKGANFTAKRGTAVRNIALTDNPAHIEGKVNGTRIVLLTCYLKKSS